mmetsp:Transcript_1049/g.4438  ORF Transcript_1049/g.4438 Transcript_1049/m.4438 type:complete len:325 (-) Transcript_1049:152-1126(-)
MPVRYRRRDAVQGARASGRKRTGVSPSLDGDAFEKKRRRRSNAVGASASRLFRRRKRNTFSECSFRVFRFSKSRLTSRKDAGEHGGRVPGPGEGGDRPVSVRGGRRRVRVGRAPQRRADARQAALNRARRLAGPRVEQNGGVAPVPADGAKSALRVRGRPKRALGGGDKRVARGVAAKRRRADRGSGPGSGAGVASAAARRKRKRAGGGAFFARREERRRRQKKRRRRRRRRRVARLALAFAGPVRPDRALRGRGHVVRPRGLAAVAEPAVFSRRRNRRREETRRVRFGFAAREKEKENSAPARAARGRRSVVSGDETETCLAR